METTIVNEGEERKEDALKIKYIRMIRMFLSTMSAWPVEQFGLKPSLIAYLYRWYLPGQAIILWFGQVYYMRTKDLDFLTLGDCFLALFLTMLLLMRLIFPLLKGYGDIIGDFIKSFHLIHFKHKGIHFLQVHGTIDKISLYFTYYMCVVTLSCGILYNISPIYSSYLNGAFSQEEVNRTLYVYSLYITYPFFDMHAHYKTFACFCVYCCVVVSVGVCVIDLLLLLMAFQAIGHVLILKRNLESISGPSKAGNFQIVRDNYTLTVQCPTYSDEENDEIGITIKECVGHHRLIVEFTDQMSDFFGPMLAANYTFQLVALCILLLESTQGDAKALIRFGPLTAMTFGQLIQISVIFEVIKTISEKLPDALYCVPWECMNRKNQRSVIFLLSRLQIPIAVTAMGMTSVGVTTMTGILKTSFSYFAFLRSMA